jgi:hypothetical protein
MNTCIVPPADFRLPSLEYTIFMACVSEQYVIGDNTLPSYLPLLAPVTEYLLTSDNTCILINICSKDMLLVTLPVLMPCSSEPLP